jgi:hypothetical protein
MSNVDSIIALRNKLANIWEAEADPDAAAVEPASAPEPEPAALPVDDQAQLDRDIDDVMTTPRQSSADDESIVAIADDLGMEDAGAFTAAFDAMRSGASTEELDNAAIIGAFERLMSADSSTVQKSINRLREIYGKPIGAPSAPNQ